MHTVLRPCFKTPSFPTFVLSMNSFEYYSDPLTWMGTAYLRIIEWDVNFVLSPSWFGYPPAKVFVSYQSIIIWSQISKRVLLTDFGLTYTYIRLHFALMYVFQNNTGGLISRPQTLVFDVEKNPGYMRVFADPKNPRDTIVQLSFGLTYLFVTLILF